MPAVKTHVVYRPKPGKEQELLALVKKHGPALESTGLITGGKPVVYKAHNIRTNQDFFIEIFSWRDEKASGLAHPVPGGRLDVLDRAPQGARLLAGHRGHGAQERFRVARHLVEIVHQLGTGIS